MANAPFESSLHIASGTVAQGLAFCKYFVHTRAVERGPRSHCPVSLALEAIGDRWSLLILRDLIMKGKSRYQEFLNSEEGISTNILADRLARLERHGLISKSEDPNDKRQFRYSPTQKGLDLLPVIFEMARWSKKYDPHIDAASPLLKRLTADKAGFMKQILSQVKGTLSK